MGPAFIVGAWQFGPGNLVSAVQAGSRFYYSLIWVIALSTVLMLAFADMSIRVGIMSRGSVVETIKKTLGRATGVAARLGVFTITLMFSVGTGLGLSLVLGGNPVWWTLACTALVATVLFARQAYKVIEKVVLAIVAAMVASFVATAIITRPDWGDAAAGLLPTVPTGVGLLLVALVGTNFSLNAAF
jgi:manganese transport protein